MITRGRTDGGGWFVNLYIPGRVTHYSGRHASGRFYHRKLRQA